MFEGRIKFLKAEKGYGFIKPESGGENVFFHQSCLEGIQFSELQEGISVEYEWKKEERGPKATMVRVPGYNDNKQTPEYRFLNPYNFVRSPGKRPSDSVLGDCPPPPHDRYLGLTGRITCKIIAKTPLFISDSHALQEENKHKSYRFFQYDGKPALPASSLRGMIRSVFETVTNSCYVKFQTDDPYPLEYRLGGAPDEMIPARVIELGDEEGALLELLDCSVDPIEKISEKPSMIKAGIIPKVYDPRVLKNKRVFSDAKSILPNKGHCGMRVAALVKKIPRNKGRYQYFEATKILPAAQYASLDNEKKAEHVRIFGWLYLTGPNIENKHDERIFFRWDDNKTPEPPSKSQIPKSLLHMCSTDVITEYNQHLSEYWERHGGKVEDLGKQPWSVRPDDLPHPSNFIARDNKLKVDDLVYLVREKGKEMLRPVAMPRVRYTCRRQDYLPKYLSCCENYSQLCPACRVFGWVRGNEKSDDLQEPVAYAGRVRFSHGVIKKSGGTEKENPLSTLSTPKPTATEFYLLNSAGKPDPLVDYDTKNAQLRGRKFYHHHEQVQTYIAEEESDQNRTVRDALKAKTEFTFEIDFENMSRLELGALIYALELEEGMFHRLGYAKPLGFGSVQISIEELKAVDWQKRLMSIVPDAGWEPKNKEKVLVLKEGFLNAICNIYGKEQYHRLQSELKAILGKQDLPIHYPRPTAQPDSKQPSFEWFVGNKKRKRSKGLPEALPLATDLNKGLPLIGKDGNPVKQ
jgi:CRISPR-associated protein (TIGR03986 family)